MFWSKSMSDLGKMMVIMGSKGLLQVIGQSELFARIFWWSYDGFSRVRWLLKSICLRRVSDSVAPSPSLHVSYPRQQWDPLGFLLANSLVRWEQEGVGVNTATLHLHTTPHCPMDSYVSTQTTYMLHLLTNTYTPLLTPCPGRPGAVSAFLTSVGAGHTWSDE